MYQRIIVALDGSELAEAVLPHAIALAERFGSRVMLLRAAPAPADLMLAEGAAGEIPVDPVVGSTEEAAADHQDALRYLEGVAARLRERGISVDTALPEGSAPDVIVATANEIEADLIAMATHAEGGLGRLLFGSVAEDVLHRARCPILMLRAKAD